MKEHKAILQYIERMYYLVFFFLFFYVKVYFCRRYSFQILHHHWLQKDIRLTDVSNFCISFENACKLKRHETFWWICLCKATSLRWNFFERKNFISVVRFSLFQVLIYCQIFVFEKYLEKELLSPSLDWVWQKTSI